MTDAKPQAGEIRAVFGGYGLMYVLRYDPATDAAEMRGHGPMHPLGHWFKANQMSKPYGAEVVLKERAEARARNVGCNNSDCWCRKFPDPSRLEDK